MKILESYKKMAKSMLTEHAWDRKFGEPLPTLEDMMKEVIKEVEMKLQPKGGGKTVTFKDKDKYEKAKKSGDYEEPEESEETDDGGEEASGKLGPGDFERDSDTTRGDSDDAWDDEEGRAKPTGKTDADTDDDDEFGYEDDEEARAQAEKDMEDEFKKESRGRTGKELGKHETLKILNEKMYRRVQEQKETSKKYSLRENYERIGGK